MAQIHTLGLPRIGKKREAKFAVEKYWNKAINESELERVGQQIRESNAELQRSHGIKQVLVNDFSWYDHVLDTSVLFGVSPSRFEGEGAANTELDQYFRLARGKAPSGSDIHPCEMTKWFNTNYHYIVPEFEVDQEFVLDPSKLLLELSEVTNAGLTPKVKLLGPLSYLWLGKAKPVEFDRLTLARRLTSAYQKLFDILETKGVEWVQIDEPILALDLDSNWLETFELVYQQLSTTELKLLLTSYFERVSDKAELIASLPVDGLHLDLVAGGWEQLETFTAFWPTEKVLSLGVIDGRNIWRANLRSLIAKLQPVHKQYRDNLWLAPSCSLLHCPVDLDSEKRLSDEVRSWLAFSHQKIAELQVLAKALDAGTLSVADALSHSDAAVASRTQSSLIHNSGVKKRVERISRADIERGSGFEERIKAQRQALQLPILPTTTIGSFPQTDTIRGLRKQFRKGSISRADYELGIEQEITHAVRQQEHLDLDVLVHGEAERNDMVEYFGENFDGFAFTQSGWVQSYGSRCVKPPIIYGDVSRSRPVTVRWSAFAQSLTDKKVKGMLTGPTTILAWSFPRDDQDEQITAFQIALALRDEVLDLEANGIDIIQIDEPAFRELLPLRESEKEAYLSWAVTAFRLSSSGVRDSTQIHTHMCYSEFNEIIEPIADLDADVITIESSRSDMELLEVFNEYEYPNEIGPGVYDIHSPRIPSTEEIQNLIQQASQHVPVERLWVNPDCGLKTRGWEEVNQALSNLVAAAKAVREQRGVKVA